MNNFVICGPFLKFYVMFTTFFDHELHYFFKNKIFKYFNWSCSWSYFHKSYCDHELLYDFCLIQPYWYWIESLILCLHCFKNSLRIISNIFPVVSSITSSSLYEITSSQWSHMRYATFIASYSLNTTTFTIVFKYSKLFNVCYFNMYNIVISYNCSLVWLISKISYW